MGTRGRIGVQHGNVIKSIYVHWDSYLEGVGSILQAHYDSARANQLVSLGDMLSLGVKIGKKHPFSEFELDKTSPYHAADLVRVQLARAEDWCKFYGRDLGEQDVSWQVAHTFEEFLEQVDACGAEYYYVMQDGVWYTGCPDKGSRLVALSEALAAAAQESA
jgi:hypothetical protein